MFNNQYSQNTELYGQREQTFAIPRTFMANVFSWMGIALAISAFVAYMFANNASLISLLFNPQTGGMSTLGWVVMLAPFGLVLLMGFGFNRLSASTLTLVFGLYAVLMGMSLSFVFMVYTSGSIAKTFVITAGLFGVMALIGYTTKTDLTKLGSILMMGLIGIIIASVVNFFMGSAQLDYIISILGVIIFTGLTAYDVQKLKRIGSGGAYGNENMRKLTILGALTLYLDFINLFLFLLRFLGDRK
jgi:FtsH-binding integral membrane protein